MSWKLFVLVSLFSGGFASYLSAVGVRGVEHTVVMVLFIFFGAVCNVFGEQSGDKP